MGGCPTYGCEKSPQIAALRTPDAGVRGASLPAFCLALISPVLAFPVLGICACMTLEGLRDRWYQHLLVPAVVALLVGSLALGMHFREHGVRHAALPFLSALLGFGVPFGTLIGSGRILLRFGSAAQIAAGEPGILLGIACGLIATGISLPLVLVVSALSRPRGPAPR